MISNIRNIGFILLYISIWLSLDSSIYNLININNVSFVEKLKGLRFVFPYIIFITLVFLYRKELILYKLDSIFKYIVYLILFSYSLQAIIPIFNGNSLLNIPFALISIILVLNLIYFYNFFDLKKIYLLGLTILFFVTLVYGSVLIHYLIFYSPNLNLYGGWPQNLEALKILSNEVPRSSGISRSSLILMIPLSFYILVEKKLNLKFYTIYLFVTFLMLSTQSRISLLVYILGIIVFIYYIFFVYKNNKLKNCFVIIILPVFFWFSSIELLSMTRTTPAFIEYFYDKFSKDIDTDDKYKRLIRIQDESSFSSNRVEDWQKIINKNQNHFFGNGVLGDRYLIDQTASSLLFYNYSSGGIVSVFIFIILIFRSIFICIKIIFKNCIVPDKDNYLILSASFVVLFLILRSLVESSFAVFGIDSLIFFSSYLLMEQSYKRINI